MEKNVLTLESRYEAPMCTLFEVEVELGFAPSVEIKDWEEDDDPLN